MEAANRERREAVDRSTGAERGVLIARSERGVSIILAIIVIVLLGFLGVIFLTMTGTGSLTAVNDLASARALAVAEGGIGYAFKTGVPPNYTFGSTTLGSGTFTTTSQFLGPGGLAPATVLNNPLAVGATTVSVTNVANYTVPGAVAIDSEYLFCTAKDGGLNQLQGCVRGWAGSTPVVHVLGTAVIQGTLTATGTVGGANRTVRTTFGQSGGTMLFEPFPNGSVPLDTAGANDCGVNPALSWCYTYQNNVGRSLYDAASNSADGTGSLLARTNVGSGNRLRGYRQRTLAAAIPAGTAITMTMAYKKNYLSAGAPNSHAFQVQLVYSTGATVTPAGWGNAAASNANAWVMLAPAAFTVPAGSTVTAVRIYFDLRNRNNAAAQTLIWFDELTLTIPGGPRLLSWQDVVQ